MSLNVDERVVRKVKVNDIWEKLKVKDFLFVKMVLLKMKKVLKFSKLFKVVLVILCLFLICYFFL